MSKKQQQLNRLNHLFSNLEGQTQPPETAPAKIHAVVQPVLFGAQ